MEDEMQNPNYTLEKVRASGAAMASPVISAPAAEPVSLSRIIDELRQTFDHMQENGKDLVMIRERVFGAFPETADRRDTGLDGMAGSTAEALHLVRLIMLEAMHQRGQIGALSNL
jgi:hypothetical protein